MAIEESEAFKGSLTRLRKITPEDLDILYSWDRDGDVKRWVGSKFSSKDDAMDWYFGGSPLQRILFAVETLSGRIIGEVEIVNISWRLHSGELRIFIGEKDYRNRGYGTDALRTLVKGLFKTTSLKEIILRVDAENLRAKRCYEKAGFKPLGIAKVKDRRSLILMNVGRAAV